MGKEFVLFPPKDFDRLSYDPKPTIYLHFEWPGPITERLDEDERKENIGSADVWNGADTPQLKSTSPMFCHVHPGETLYLPAYWHHTVISHPAQGPDCPTSPLASLAINLWFQTNATKASFGGRHGSSTHN